MCVFVCLCVSVYACVCMCVCVSFGLYHSVTSNVQFTDEWMAFVCVSVYIICSVCIHVYTCTCVCVGMHV